jgi:hypothetical protein
MRKLIVPQRTASGKLSSRILPDVTVVFESQGADPGPPQGKSVGNSKKVCNISLDALSLALNCSKSKQLAKDDKFLDPCAPDEEHKALCCELQTIYRCEVHTIKEGVECYCYPEQSNPAVHRIMTFNDLGFWASQIVSITL